MRSLPGRVILVVGSSLSSLEVYHATPFRLVEFLLRNQLLTLWEFPCMLFVVFPLLLSIIFLCLKFCQFDYYVSQHVSLWVYPVWGSLCFLDLINYFLSLTWEKNSHPSPGSAESPIQNKPKEKHAKTHSNQSGKN